VLMLAQLQILLTLDGLYHEVLLNNCGVAALHNLQRMIKRPPSHKQDQGLILKPCYGETMSHSLIDRML